jgi:hypothetical protein
MSLPKVRFFLRLRLSRIALAFSFFPGAYL